MAGLAWLLDGCCEGHRSTVDTHFSSDATPAQRENVSKPGAAPAGRREKDGMSHTSAEETAEELSDMTSGRDLSQKNGVHVHDKLQEAKFIITMVQNGDFSHRKTLNSIIQDHVRALSSICDTQEEENSEHEPCSPAEDAISLDTQNDGLDSGGVSSACEAGNSCEVQMSRKDVSPTADAKADARGRIEKALKTSPRLEPVTDPDKSIKDPVPEITLDSSRKRKPKKPRRIWPKQCIERDVYISSIKDQSFQNENQTVVKCGKFTTRCRKRRKHVKKPKSPKQKVAKAPPKGVYFEDDSDNSEDLFGNNDNDCDDNKKQLDTSLEVQNPVHKRSRGRPKGSKNKQKPPSTKFVPYIWNPEEKDADLFLEDPQPISGASNNLDTKCDKTTGKSLRRKNNPVLDEHSDSLTHEMHKKWIEKQSPGPFLCSLCGKVYDRGWKLELHLVKEHGEGKKDKHCDECQETFYTDYQLKKHERDKHEERLECELCGKFVRKASMWEHVNYMHSDPKFLCSLCGFTATRKNHLKRHVESVHKKLRQYPCPYEGCTRAFRCKSTVQKHVEVLHDGIKKYECPWPGCTKAFGRKYHLDRHHLQHSGEKPVCCPICTYTCRQKTSLDYHMKRKHPGINDILPSTNTQYGTDQPEFADSEKGQEPFILSQPRVSGETEQSKQGAQPECSDQSRVTFSQSLPVHNPQALASQNFDASQSGSHRIMTPDTRGAHTCNQQPASQQTPEQSHQMQSQHMHDGNKQQYMFGFGLPSSQPDPNSLLAHQIASFNQFVPGSQQTSGHKEQHMDPAYLHPDQNSGSVPRDMTEYLQSRTHINSIFRDYYYSYAPTADLKPD